jgi:hypothetical protein
LKGSIAESLVRQYVEDETMPSLEKEGWDYVFFMGYLPEIVPYDNLPPEQRPIQHGGKFFISKDIFPNREFLTNLRKLDKLIEHEPDGFLVKLKKTGETKPLKEAFVEFGLFGVEGYIGRSKNAKNEQLPMVDGEIEIIEVKSDKAHLQASQRKNYIKVVSNGYALRYFHVRIVSFEKNQYEIEEKLITNPKQI